MLGSFGERGARACATRPRRAPRMRHARLATTSPRRVSAQGLLAAAAAGVRARLRQAQTLQPLLQTRAGRERAQAALLDAGAALEAAQRIVQGAGPGAAAGFATARRTPGRPAAAAGPPRSPGLERGLRARAPQAPPAPRT